MRPARAQVITAGAINVDLIVGVEHLPGPGETVPGPRVVRQGGCKSADQSVAASRMGAEVQLIGAVGDDDLGRLALDGLRREGVHD